MVIKIEIIGKLFHMPKCKLFFNLNMIKYCLKYRSLPFVAAMPPLLLKVGIFIDLRPFGFNCLHLNVQLRSSAIIKASDLVSIGFYGDPQIPTNILI